MNQLPPLGKSKDKFTPELRILVASLLSMAVILLWAKFFGPKPPVNPPQENQPAQVSTATPGSTAPANSPSAPATPAKISAAPAVAATADSQERTIVVENALYRVEFSNRGAVVKSWQLKNYKDDCDGKRKDEACFEDNVVKQQGTLDLVHKQAAAERGGWPFALVFDDPQLGTLANSGLYKISSDANSLEAPADLTFTWSDGHLQVTKKFHFDHSYTVSVETTVTNNGNHVMTGVAWLGGFGDPTVTNPIPVETVFTFYSEGGKLSTFAHKKLDGPEKWGNVWQGGKEFTGIEDRYFTATFLPPLNEPTPLQTRYWKVFHNIKVDGKDQSEPVPEIATATAAQNMALRVYVGPKDYDDLKAMHPPLHSLVQFGYLEFIADPLFHGLKWVHKYISNYGWAIVVLTLVINMLLFPLRISSYKTTLKM